MRSKSSRSLPKAILSHFSSLTLSRNRRLHRSQNSTSPLQYLQGLILPELFVELVDAVEAVLEMVLAIVVYRFGWLPLPGCCCPGAVRHAREVCTNRCLRRRAPRRGCPQRVGDVRNQQGREGRAFLRRCEALLSQA